MKFLTLGLAILLTACGGGSSGDPTTTTPVSKSATEPAAQPLFRQVQNQIDSINIGITYAVGDLNGDGLDDVVAGGWSERATSTLNILIQNADGTLTDKTLELVGSNLYPGSNRILISDFDHDGHLDIWLPGFNDFCNDCSALSVMLWGSALGKFTKQTFDVGLNSHGACLADMNRDGNMDMLVRGQFHDNGETFYGYYLNNGNRTFTFVSALYANGASNCTVITDTITGHLAITQGNNPGGNHVPGYNSSINILDSNLNLIKQIGVASSGRPGDDFINSISVDANGDGLEDFILIFGSSADRGRKEVWLNLGNDNFSYAYTLDTGYMNSVYSQRIYYNGKTYLFFDGPQGDAVLYQLDNGKFVTHKRDSFLTMATSLGGNIKVNDWSVKGAVVYRGQSGLYMFQNINGKYHTQKL